MNLSRFLMKSVSRPLASRSSDTWFKGKGSARRLGGVNVPTGAFTTTVAVTATCVPAIRPVTL